VERLESKNQAVILIEEETRKTKRRRCNLYLKKPKIAKPITHSSQFPSHYLVIGIITIAVYSEVIP
jgi:hypothetical protein